MFFERPSGKREIITQGRVEWQCFCEKERKRKRHMENGEVGRGGKENERAREEEM